MAQHLLRAKDLADARYRDALSVADLAAAVGLSPAYFSRRFKATFGESPHQYLLTRRLERAAALLCSTDWTVADICSIPHEAELPRDDRPGRFSPAFLSRGPCTGAVPVPRYWRGGRGGVVVVSWWCRGVRVEDRGEGAEGGDLGGYGCPAAMVVSDAKLSRAGHFSCKAGRRALRARA
jgi:hypothetical protein